MASLDARKKISPVRILVVDDSPLMRRCLRKMLEQQGSWQVCCEASNGREAIGKGKQKSPALSILVFQMPRMSGPGAGRTASTCRAGDKGNIGRVGEGVETLLHRGTYYRNWPRLLDFNYPAVPI